MNVIAINGRRYVRLIAQPGTDEANYGDERFTRRPNGVFVVPIEAAEGLCRVGGFHEAPPPEPGADEIDEALAEHDVSPELAAHIVEEIERGDSDVEPESSASDSRFTLTIPNLESLTRPATPS